MRRCELKKASELITSRMAGEVKRKPKAGKWCVWVPGASFANRKRKGWLSGCGEGWTSSVPLCGCCFMCGKRIKVKEASGE